MDSYSMISHALYYNMYNNDVTQSRLTNTTIHGTEIIMCTPLIHVANKSNSQSNMKYKT